jgi:uncharacterized membrane protein YfcA
MVELGLVLAALIGLSLGLLGGGGSILAVPIFVYVLGFEPRQSIAMSLAVVGSTSLIGAVGHWRAGNANPRVALTFGPVAMAGSYLGARLAVLFSAEAQLTLFAIVMLAAAGFMLTHTEERHTHAAAARMPAPLIVAQGAAVGVLTGLVGVGGGFLVVPALVMLGGIPMKEAIGTSLVVIAMNSAAGFVGYLGQVEVPWKFMSEFTAVAVAGVLAGTHLVRFVRPAALRRSFAVCLLVVGTAILYQNRNTVRLASCSTAVFEMDTALESDSARN